MLAVFATSVIVVAAPWTHPGDNADGVPARRYAMLEDGHAVLLKVTDAAGKLREFESRSDEVLPGLRALNDLPPPVASAIADHVVGKGKSTNDALAARGRLTSARVVEVLHRHVSAEGSAATDSEVQVLDHRGLYSLSFQSVARDPLPTILSPPLELLPPNPHLGEAWSATGMFGSTPYSFKARIASRGPISDALGSFDDCVGVTSTLTVLKPGGSSTRTSNDVYCNGIGVIEGSSVESDGSTTRFAAVSIDGQSSSAAPPTAAPGETGGNAGPSGDPSGWSLTRVGSALPRSSIGSATVPPVYLPTDPPSVLASADAGGDLVAIGVGDARGTVSWRFPTGGAIYSVPRYDAARGRVYFGSTDGRVRALDWRGVFLWSTAAADNVATRPAVSGDVVVFGSEDGSVYGADAETGRRRWHSRVGGAVVSSPAVVGGVAAVGDDGGTVTGLNPRNGDSLWTYTAGGAVEAPIGQAGNDLLVGDREGTLARLGSSTGRARWVATVGDGAALRTEPALMGRRVLVVDSGGGLTAVEAASGQVSWHHRGRGYVGSPAVVGSLAVVARTDGRIDVIDATGRTIKSVGPGGRGRAGAGPGFSYGGTAGGGSLWFADEGGTVWALGPGNSKGPSGQLTAAWTHSVNEPPFLGVPLTVSATVWRDQFLALDARRHSFKIDPRSGTTTIGPTIGSDGDVVLAEPVVSGDTLIVDAGRRGIAVDLLTGNERWSTPLSRQGFRSPPAVSGNIVVFLSAVGGGAELRALKLDSGEEIWRAPTGAGALNSGALIVGDTVVAGSPLAGYDLATGRPRWRSSVEGPSGTPALAGDGSSLITATAPGQAGSAGLVSIGLSDGVTRWSVQTPGHELAAFGALLVVGKTAVLASVGGPVIGYDIDNGHELWRKEFPSSVLGTPSVVGDHVWLALLSGQVVSVSSGGAIAASFEGVGISGAPISLAQRPTQTSGIVAVITGNTIFALNEAS